MHVFVPLAYRQSLFVSNCEAISGRTVDAFGISNASWARRNNSNVSYTAYVVYRCSAQFGVVRQSISSMISSVRSVEGESKNSRQWLPLLVEVTLAEAKRALAAGEPLRRYVAISTADAGLT